MNKSKICKTAIVKIELEYVFDKDSTEDEINNYIQNVELPEEYKEDSWKLVKIIND